MARGVRSDVLFVQLDVAVIKSDPAGLDKLHEKGLGLPVEFIQIAEPVVPLLRPINVFSLRRRSLLALDELAEFGNPGAVTIRGAIQLPASPPRARFRPDYRAALSMKAKRPYCHRLICQRLL